MLRTVFYKPAVRTAAGSHWHTFESATVPAGLCLPTMKQRQEPLREPHDDLDQDENDHDPLQTHGPLVIGLVGEGRVERVEQA